MVLYSLFAKSPLPKMRSGAQKLACECPRLQGPVWPNRWGCVPSMRLRRHALPPACGESAPIGPTESGAPCSPSRISSQNSLYGHFEASAGGGQREIAFIAAPETTARLAALGNAGYTTSTSASWPEAEAILRSRVSNGAPRTSASATYTASYAVSGARSSQTRGIRKSWG